MVYRVKHRDRADSRDSLAPDSRLPRVCIIGAGSSGLAAAKAMHEARVPFACYERGTRLGGNWVIDNDNGVSACYETLEINTSTSRMAFSDFPMPREYPPYARHDQVASYFEDYARHFGFRDRITFGTEVTDVRPEGDGWLVDIRPSGRGEDGAGPSTERFDAVIVANGHHWDAHWPRPEYPGSFDGEQIHSHQYRDARQLAGRDVVVVGAGNSAMDIACEAARVSRSAVISQRHGEWVLRKFTGPIPSDVIALPGWMPYWATALRLRVSALLSGDVSRLGLPRPQHRPGQSHPVQSEGIRAALRGGGLVPRGAIERLEKDRVIFRDGSSAPADLIVWATGYDITFPFLGEDLQQRLNRKGNSMPLWLRLASPEVPGLFFVGLLQPVGAVMPIAEAQSELIADHLRGSYQLPDPDSMRRRMRRDDEANKRHFYTSRRHTIEVDFDHFLRDIARERKAGEDRAARLPASAAGAAAAAGTSPVPGSPPHGGALVTGAGQGLGREIARLLARRGYLVHVTDIAADHAEQVAAGIREQGGRAIASAIDVRDEDAVRAAAARTVREAGALEVWVNNAGVLTTAPVWEQNAEVRSRQIDINVTGVMNGTLAALEHMRPAGSGHVITVASLAAIAPVPGEGVYAASKHAALGFGLSTLADLRAAGEKDIHISHLCPDGMWTPMLHDLTEDPQAAMSFAGKLYRPEEVASWVGELLDHPRPLLARPWWRAGMSRAFSAFPRLIGPLVPAVMRDARRRQRRMGRRLRRS